MNTTIILIRHGEKLYSNSKGPFGSKAHDPPLVESSLRNVTNKGSELINKYGVPTQCIISPYLRTRQTAEIVSSMLQIERIVYDERLRDLNWGIYAGGPKKDALDFYTDKNRMNDRPLNGESWGDLKNRVEECLNDIESINEGKNILLVSHGDAILLLQAYVNDWDLEEIILQRENIIGTGELRKLN